MEPKKRGRPPKAVPATPAGLVRVRCVTKNVWTSTNRKLFPGDEAEVPAAEAAAMLNVEIIE